MYPKYKEKKVTLDTTKDDSFNVSQHFITIIIPIPQSIGSAGDIRTKRNPTIPPINVPKTLCDPILKDVLIVSCIVTTHAVAQ